MIYDLKLNISAAFVNEGNILINLLIFFFFFQLSTNTTTSVLVKVKAKPVNLFKAIYYK